MNTMTQWLDDNFQEVDARGFYRVIFPAGELDTKEAFTKGKYTGIIITVSRDKVEYGKRKVCRYTITDDLDEVERVTTTNDFCLCSPLSYAGKKRSAENARMLYAIAIDVDKMKYSRHGSPDGLRSLWKQVEEAKYLPRPTFIVSSGTGLHLYYVLQNPVPLYEDLARELQRYKRELTRKVWNGAIVNIESEKDIQQEGIYQGFRMPGTITKQGGRARAFRTGDKVTLEYLNCFVEEQHKAKKSAKQKQRGTVRLEEAASRWPDWYERRIVKQEPRGVWHTNRALYDWWLRQIKIGATVHHRYYCVMMLAIYAQKCGMYDEKHNPNPVTQEELEQDAYSLVDFLEGMTVSDDNHFGADDVQAALEAYQSKWIRYPREAVQGKTGITIPANKRNGRTQNIHLRVARSTLDVLNKENGCALQGRPSVMDVVAGWRDEHPDGTKAACIRETGLSKPTVYKWWNGDNPNKAKASKQEKAHIADEIRAEQLALAGELHSNWKVLYTNLKSMQITMDTMRGLAGLLQEGEEKKNLMDMLNKTNNDYCTGVESMKNTIEMMERLAATLPECEEKQKFVAIYENAREGYRELIERVNR